MNILQMVEQKAIFPRKVSTAKGGEYHSACPACGGEDRFHIWPAQGEDGTFWCRGCDQGGDAVKYLRIYEGMSCGAAHAALGRACVSTTCPKIDSCLKGKGNGGKRKEGNTAAPPKPRLQNWKPGAAECPGDLWREHAGKIVEAAHATLLASPEKLAYLAGRGLPLEAVQKDRLGWLEKDTYRAREAWGLPTELREDGKPKKLWLPKGIVIPYLVDGELHRLRIRRDELQNPTDARYYWVPGSGNDVVVINPGARAFVVIESDLDGLMVDHAAGDLVGVIPLGTSDAKPKETAAQILAAAISILVALDFEPRRNQKTGQLENPGGKAAKWWCATYPQARRWPVPTEKDPGEAYAAGVDIRAWILAGLPPAMTVQSKAPARKDAPESTMGFDPQKMQQQINDTFSRVTSQAPKGAQEWLVRHRPDVLQHLARVDKDVDAAFESGDESVVVKALDTWERYYLLAWQRYNERPPVIEVDEPVSNTGV